jgi:hypothetical protein
MNEAKSEPTIFDRARAAIEAKGCGGEPGKPKRLAAQVSFVYHEWTCGGCQDCAPEESRRDPR